MPRPTRIVTGFLRQIVSAVLLFAVIAGIVLFLLFRDNITSETLNDFLDFFRSEPTSTVSRYRFDQDDRNRFLLTRGRLCVLSPERLVVFAHDGTEAYSRSVAFDSPALTAAGHQFAAYDRTGNAILVGDINNLRREEQIPVSTVAGSANGSLLTVTQEHNYVNAVNIQNSKGKQVYSWKSAQYVFNAAIAPTGRRFAVVSFATKETEIRVRLLFLDTRNPEPIGEATLPEAPLYLFYPRSDRVCAVTASAVFLYNETGKIIHTTEWSGKTLVRSVASAENLYLQLARYPGAPSCELIALDWNGKSDPPLSIASAVTDFSAAAGFLSVLTEGKVTRYLHKGSGLLENRAQDAPGATKVLQQENGSALLIYDESAQWAFD